MIRRFTVLLLTLLLISSLGVVAGVPGPDRDTANASSVDADVTHSTASVAATTTSPGTSDETPLIRESIVLEQRPDEPGVIGATVTYEVPDAVTELTVRPDAHTTVTDSSGFEPEAGGSYKWAAGDGTPSLTLEIAANRTNEGRHIHQQTDRHTAPHANEHTQTGAEEHARTDAHEHAHDHEDGHTFVETGEWGIVAVPQFELGWVQRAPVGTDRTVTVDGPGVAGTDIVYFGESTTYTETVRGETITLVVPDAADLEESPTDVLASLAAASDELRVGARSTNVLVVAAPTGTVEWGANGIQYGDSDAWVRDDARLDVPGNVWLHEYVHTRQAFASSDIDPTVAWLIEGQAEYYAATLTYEQGHIDHREFRRFLEEGQESPYADGVLADPGTWQDPLTDYVKGPLVYGAVDRQLRLESNGEYTIEDAFRALNRAEKPVTEQDWLEALEQRGGSPVREYAMTYTHTDSTPESWDEAAHELAFGQPTPAFEYSLAAGEPLAFEGLLERSTRTEPRPLVVGETMTVPIAVDNRGDRAGTYRATLQVDGSVVADADGTLESGGSTVEHLTWTPEAPGRYALKLGDEPATVDVLEPADLTVTALEVSPESVEPGEPVTVRATVENDAARAGQTTIQFRTSSGVADEQQVTLAPGEMTTVETTITFEREAHHEIAVGDRRVTVAVERSLTSQASGATDSIPGFTAGATIVALLALVVVGSRGSYRRLEWR
ncbi:CARDB domain-containing protein [Natronosalvus amylolyticus]|uniref:CARDB domain-containing protein n=1 Tax=Natronosalvus amylolyticus TaxID=2961994 RepID=UPI0020C989C9|nr:CARDB domain-containing protein [Natronosalvus amylolyticus]